MCRLPGVEFLPGERVWRTSIRGHDAVMEALQSLPGLDMRVEGLHAVPRSILQVALLCLAFHLFHLLPRQTYLLFLLDPINSHRLLPILMFEFGRALRPSIGD